MFPAAACAQAGSVSVRSKPGKLPFVTLDVGLMLGIRP